MILVGEVRIYPPPREAEERLNAFARVFNRSFVFTPDKSRFISSKGRFISGILALRVIFVSAVPSPYAKYAPVRPYKRNYT